MKKILLIIIFVLFIGNILKSQTPNCQPGVGQFAGVIAWKGKKIRSSGSEDPSSGTMTFIITCDRNVEGTCFYADNGQADTIVKKVCEGVMSPSVQNVVLYDEFHVPIHKGTLHAYWDNSLPDSPIWIREYTFYYE